MRELPICLSACLMSTHLPLSPACGLGAWVPLFLLFTCGGQTIPFNRETGPWLFLGVLGLAMLSLHSPLFPPLGPFVGRIVTMVPVDGLAKWGKE